MPLEDRIHLPPLNLIHRRPRLIRMLDGFVEAGYRLVTIYAPGGYGKSILLADFTQTTNLPVCWCSLETSDRDPTSFLTMLVYSITDRFHELDADSLFQLVERGDTQNSVRRIAEVMHNVGPHIIIIDDYHKAVSAGVTLALNQLLAQLPETSAIIIAARGDMGLETGQIIDLLMSDRVTGLSEEELRFTPKEVQFLMRKRFGRQIDAATSADIARATDGNIAQILLTGHMMKADPKASSLKQRLGDDHEVIYQYLATEVFDKQSSKLQQFMLHTAVLPDITVEFCDELLNSTDAQTYIEALVYNDLFITQIGGGFRYHDLFAEFLRSKLREDQTLYYQVTIKAANLLTAHGQVADAIPLYLSVQAWDEAAQLLERQGRDFYNTGRALTLNSWFTQIPKQELVRHPHLLLLQGQILGNDIGKLDQALSHFKQAEEQFVQKNNSTGIAEAQISQASALRMMGHPEKALTLARQGLNQLEILKADKHYIAVAVRSLGLAHLIAGNTTVALLDLRRALELFEQLDDMYTAATCHHEIGMCLVAQGNINGADHHYRQALNAWETLGNANDLANTLNSLGVSLLTVGRYEEALEQFNISLDVALQIRSIRRAAFAQAGIADVYLESNEFDRAIQAYNLSTEFAQEASVRSLEIYNLIKTGECFYRQHDLNQALQLAVQARELATETGLGFETGLATALQAKIFVRRGEYGASFPMFSEAATLFSDKNVLEQAKARLWWGYSLLLDSRPSAAFEQLQEVIRLGLSMGDLIRGLESTVAEVRYLLLHFLHRTDTPTSARNNIWLLLSQSKNLVDVAYPGLQIFALGPPLVIAADQRKQFNQRGGMSKVPEFLLYLLLEGQDHGCTWSEISAAIWPDLNREKASVKFHQILRSLRRNTLTERDYILVQGDYYQVNPAYLDWCDALAFNQLFDRLTRSDVTEKLALYLELISLYQGEFLTGFELGEWGEMYRTQYETRYLQVVELASEQLLNANALQEALNIIKLGLSQDYFREELHCNAFKAYAQAGLYDDLAAHYSELCYTFDLELDAPPSVSTIQLYEQLIAKREVVT